MSGVTNIEPGNPERVPPKGRKPAANGSGAEHPSVEEAVNNVVPISDPGDDAPSAYTSAPNFAGRQGIKRKTTILLKNPKNYCRSLYSMAMRMGMVTLIDVAKADAMEKDLHLILPEIANDDDLMHDVVGAFEALAVPFVDRHGIPHLSCIRQYSTDGREIRSFGSACAAAEFAEAHWTLITWQAGEWEYEEHRNPEKLRLNWPPALRRYDDWLENAFPGRIIRAGDHDILEMARGKR